MPQLNLLKPGEYPTGLRITWEDRTPDLEGAFDTTIHLRRRDGDWTALIVQRWSGTMLDLADSWTQAVTNAWLWGDRRDVLRAAVAQHRQAKKHARVHDRV